MEQLADVPPVRYDDEKEAEHKIADVAVDVIEGSEGQCLTDSPWVTTETVVITDIFIPTDG